MKHHTKTKGDIGIAKVICDLTVKGYEVFTPLSEHSKTDLIAIVDNKPLRLQVKYVGQSVFCVPKSTSWADKKGNHVTKYSTNDFDYFAIYLEVVDKIIYPASSFLGVTIRCEKALNNNPIYWYEDFLGFTDTAEKVYSLNKRLVEKLPETKRKFIRRKANKPPTKIAKINWMPDEELQKRLWEVSTVTLAKELGISECAIRKRVKLKGLTKPPVGYWNKVYAGKIDTL